MPELICIAARWLRNQLSPLIPGDGALLSIDMDDVFIRAVKAKKLSGATAEHLQLRYVRHAGDFPLKTKPPGGVGSADDFAAVGPDAGKCPVTKTLIARTVGATKLAY